ncbi:MAG TPA: hypothetical protein VG652_02050 [Gaiellaceae bacterium]|nr:hypothetical protein [Gaiellaceae bacterium]
MGSYAESPIVHVVVGGACFFATMLACCAIEPSWTAVRIGLSYYGNSITTCAPYAIGFVLCIGITARGLLRIRPSHPAARRFRHAVGLVLTLMVPIPLTPYRLDLVFDWLHIGAATLLFLAGLMLGLWLAFRFNRTGRAKLWFALEALAAISILTAQLGVHDYMIPSELAFQLSVLGLIVHSVRRLSACGLERRTSS